jgi:hypothetical protein
MCSYAVSTAACSDSDKVACHAVRALGQLLGHLRMGRKDQPWSAEEGVGVDPRLATLEAAVKVIYGYAVISST